MPWRKRASLQRRSRGARAALRRCREPRLCDAHPPRQGMSARSMNPRRYVPHAAGDRFLTPTTLRSKRAAPSPWPERCSYDLRAPKSVLLPPFAMPERRPFTLPAIRSRDSRMDAGTAAAVETLLQARPYSAPTGDVRAAWLLFRTFTDRLLRNLDRLIAWAGALSPEGTLRCADTYREASYERERLLQLREFVRPRTRRARRCRGRSASDRPPAPPVLRGSRRPDPLR